MEAIQSLMREWYLLLSQASVTFGTPIKEMAEGIDRPLLSVFLFGLVGALSPCQLTTNLSAMAYVSRKVGEGKALQRALAYTFGKALVYMVIGGVVIFLGLKVDQVLIPVVVAARKAIGPLMIFVGLGLLDLIRLRASVGQRFSSWLHSRLPLDGRAGAFSLGMVLSTTFCPTLFWLFFGLMIPLALTSAVGWTFPGLFALGTAFPVLAFSALLTSGTDFSERFMERLKRSQRGINQASGAIFILAGANDTLIYWFL
jgi:cytochrome c biogenesis protein CcdA